MLKNVSDSMLSCKRANSPIIVVEHKDIPWSHFESSYKIERHLNELFMLLSFG